MVIFSMLIFIFAVLSYLLLPLSKTTRYVGATIIVGAMYAAFWPSIHKNYLLEKAGYQTTGVITAKSCDGGRTQRIEYKFLAGDKEASGASLINTNNHSCDRPRVGDQIFVTYLVDDPSVNLPEREVKSHLFLGILFALGGMVSLVWLNGEQARSRKKAR